jgi:hypothetical protein
MMVLESRDRGQKYVDDVKMALVSAEPSRWIRLVFPNTEVSVPESMAFDEDDLNTDGEWKFTGPVTPEEAQAMLAEALNQARSGSLSMDDIDSAVHGQVSSENDGGVWE